MSTEFNKRRPEMNDKLLKAFVELVEASFERDFLAENGGKSRPEERVFDAVEGALDEILADPELASLHNWVRSLWAKQEASEQAAQVP